MEQKHHGVIEIRQCPPSKTPGDDDAIKYDILVYIYFPDFHIFL